NVRSAGLSPAMATAAAVNRTPIANTTTSNSARRDLARRLINPSFSGRLSPDEGRTYSLSTSQIVSRFSALEAAAVQSGRGDLRPVVTASGRIDRVPPLGEELGERRPARRGLAGQERRERRLELRLRDAPLPEGALDPL